MLKFILMQYFEGDVLALVDKNKSVLVFGHIRALK